MEGEQVTLKEVGYRELKGLIKEGDALQVADEQYIIMEELYRCIIHSLRALPDYILSKFNLKPKLASITILRSFQ